MNVCVVGSTMIDLVTRVPRLPKLGETLAGSSFAMGYGGKGGNQAVTAAKLGARVTMVTRIGTDSFGDGALENYRAHGIDVHYVVRDPARVSGVAPIFVDDDAQNVVVIVPGANAALDIHDVARAQPAIEDADVLVCQLEVPVETVLAAFAIARAAGVRTIFNPAPAGPVPDALWGLTDVALPNETEAEALTGIAVANDGDAGRAARALLDRGAGAVILTLGRRGSLVVTAGGVDRIEPVRVSAVDPTGAGDAYVGTLAVCLAAKMPLLDAARRANLVAALSVTAAGTQTSFPDRAAADAFVAGYGLDLPESRAAEPR
jgi:ribokinase